MGHFFLHDSRRVPRSHGTTAVAVLYLSRIQFWGEGLSSEIEENSEKKWHTSSIYRTSIARPSKEDAVIGFSVPFHHRRAGVVVCWVLCMSSTGGHG